MLDNNARFQQPKVKYQALETALIELGISQELLEFLRERKILYSDVNGKAQRGLKIISDAINFGIPIEFIAEAVKNHSHESIILRLSYIISREGVGNFLERFNSLLQKLDIRLTGPTAMSKINIFAADFCLEDKNQPLIQSFIMLNGKDLLISLLTQIEGGVVYPSMLLKNPAAVSWLISTQVPFNRIVECCSHNQIIMMINSISQQNFSEFDLRVRKFMNIKDCDLKEDENVLSQLNIISALLIYSNPQLVEKFINISSKEIFLFVVQSDDFSTKSIYWAIENPRKISNLFTAAQGDLEIISKIFKQGDRILEVISDNAQKTIGLVRFDGVDIDVVLKLAQNLDKFQNIFGGSINSIGFTRNGGIILPHGMGFEYPDWVRRVSSNQNIYNQLTLSMFLGYYIEVDTKALGHLVSSFLNNSECMRLSLNTKKFYNSLNDQLLKLLDKGEQDSEQANKYLVWSNRIKSYSDATRQGSNIGNF